MSNRTREINKITMAVIRISVKLMVYALIILLLYEAVIRGYAFGHAVFFAEAVDAPPGRTVTIQMSGKESVSQAAKKLADRGLIKSEFAFLFQSRFYDYDTIYPGSYELNTSMTSKEILQTLNEDPENEEEIKSHPAARTAVQGGESDRDMADSPAEDAKTAEGTERAADRNEGAAEAGSGFAGTEPESTQDIYGDLDQEAEGGWIEDLGEVGEE